jgi:hypothetical protein
LTFLTLNVDKIYEKPTEASLDFILRPFEDIVKRAKREFLNDPN